MAKQRTRAKKTSLTLSQAVRQAMKVLGSDGTRELIDLVKADTPPCQIKRQLMPYLRRYVKGGVSR